MKQPAQPQDSTLAVWVKPGSSRDRVDGFAGEELVVVVRARAVDGAANAAVCRVVAAALGLRPRQVSVRQGHRARHKVLVVGMTEPDLRLRLAGLIDP